MQSVATALEWESEWTRNWLSFFFFMFASANASGIISVNVTTSTCLWTLLKTLQFFPPSLSLSSQFSIVICCWFIKESTFSLRISSFLVQSLSYLFLSYWYLRWVLAILRYLRQEGLNEILQYVYFSLTYKAIPLKAWTGPEDSRSLRFPDFKTIVTWRWQGCQPYAPPAFTPQEIFLVLISVRGWVDPRAIVRPEGLYCSAVPQPTGPPRVSQSYIHISKCFFEIFSRNIVTIVQSRWRHG